MNNAQSTRHTFQDFIASLEELMVKQFRGLQTLVQITTQERLELSKGNAQSLKHLAKQKETTLEQIGIVGDSLHMIFEEIGKHLGMSKMISLNEDLLPRMDPIPAERIGRLRDGIITLYDEVRELKLGNQALARQNLYGPEAVQHFFLGDYFAPEIFDTLGHLPTRKKYHTSKPV